MGTTKNDHPEIIRLYTEAGLPTTKIANRYGVTSGTIAKLLRRSGVKMRRTWASKTRVCGHCGKELPISDFYNRDHVCKACKYQYNKERGDVYKRFGMTLDDYSSLFEKQGGVCAICGKPVSKNGRDLAVDHDHKTGNVRGLLCNSCNRAIGFFHDSPDVLQKAIEYLSRRAREDQE